MEVIRIIVNIVLIIASAGLIAVVLMQKGSGKGLGSAFGGDSNSFNKARNVAASKEAKLQKITVIFGVVIGVLAIAMMFFA